MAQVESYGFTIDTDKIPEASMIGLLRRGLAHLFGNEVASAAVTAEKNFKPTNGEAFNRDEWRKQAREAKYAEVMNGQLGTRTVGPRVDPVERKFAELVEKTAKVQMKQHGYKWPKNEEAVITFGNGMTRTRQQLRDAVVKNAGVKLRREAERLVAAEARLATKVADAGAFDPDQLGA